MADVFIGHDFKAQTFPYQQAQSFPQTSYTGQPWGQAIVDESWDSQVIPSGDTGTINIDVQIPNDYVSLLRTFKLQAYDDATIFWRHGHMGLAYQQPGGPYLTTTSELQEKDYLWWSLLPEGEISVRDRFGTGINIKNFDVGKYSAVSSTYYKDQDDYRLNDPTKIPLWLPPGEANLKNRAMVIYLTSDSAQPSNRFRFNAVFDLYTQEQAYSSSVMSSPRRLS